nr:hypothetical protein [Gammaproteobacteria bacterium]
KIEILQEQSIELTEKAKVNSSKLQTPAQIEKYKKWLILQQEKIKIINKKERQMKTYRTLLIAVILITNLSSSGYNTMVKKQEEVEAQWEKEQEEKKRRGGGFLLENISTPPQ